MSEGTATIDANVQYLYIDKETINKKEILEWVSKQIEGTWAIETTETLDKITYSLSRIVEGERQPALQILQDGYLVILESIQVFGISKRINCLPAQMFLEMAHLN